MYVLLLIGIKTDTYINHYLNEVANSLWKETDKIRVFGYV